MFVRRIDGAVSRMMRALTGNAPCGRPPTPALSGKQPTGNVRLATDFGLAGQQCVAPLNGHLSEQTSADAITPTENLSSSPRWTASGLMDAGFDLAGQCAGFLGGLRERGDGRVRWLEFGNKIAAYRLFDGHDINGHEPGETAICQLDPYSRLFAAEGYSYRNAREGALAPELPAEFSLISIHAGAGLWLAEQALEDIHAGRCISQALTDFSAMCQRVAVKGFGGIVEEALGLIACTLYPHLLERLDGCLRAMNTGLWERFWHGAGRGIYFAPSNFLLFRAAPWSGLSMCMREPPHEAGKRNALSGFCFALTLVNLRQPEVLETFFKHHAAQAADCVDGVRSAMAVWTISSEGNETMEPIDAYRFSALLPPWPLTDEDRRQPERLFSARSPGQ